MAKVARKSTDAIEKLLAEKSEVEQWLEKLDAAGNKTPKNVRDKVRGDYEVRLDKVLKALQGFKDDLVSSLEEQEAGRGRLEELESAAAERLAEAELRHSVGEYDESSWEELRSEIQGELDGVREELETAEAEITKLEGIIQLIDEGPSAAAPEAERAPEPEEDEIPEPATAAAQPEVAELEEEIDEIEELEDDIEDLPGRPSQTEAFDEMAFLKSVTEDDAHGPSADRASGTHSAIDLESKDSRDVVSAKEVDVPTKGRSKKSLKCGECGAKNLPTEWYCERCGAELAAL